MLVYTYKFVCETSNFANVNHTHIYILPFQLNFIGVTVDPDRRYIHFPSSKHMFTPVPVGEKISPKQVHIYPNSV